MKREINEIIEKETQRLENIGCEVTNVEIEENVVKFYVNDYNNDCGNFHQIRKMFLKKHQPQKRKPQSGELSEAEAKDFCLNNDPLSTEINYWEFCLNVSVEKRKSDCCGKCPQAIVLGEMTFCKLGRDE